MHHAPRARVWPAVDVDASPDDGLLLALVDDFGPTAVESTDAGARVFFQTVVDRNNACRVLLDAHHHAAPVDVDDGDWAKRSQESLRPVTVGRITVTPPWHQDAATLTSASDAITIVIQPSMGFGTGHHATTRLCLRALQSLDLSDRFVVDVGTGSGVLAIAASALGGLRSVGVDNDADAIQCARENLALNPEVQSTTFEVADLFRTPLPLADVILANLTGAVLTRAAATLFAHLRPGGTLIVSGLLQEERGSVVAAFGSPCLTFDGEEEGWLALGMKRA